MKALYLVLFCIFLLACGLSSEQLTATAVAAEAQTQTAAPTVTATETLIPTSTPEPTSTSTPTVTPEPTPAPIGETVQYGSLEITLLEVVTHSHIAPSGFSFWYSKPGEIFIDMTVLVRNTGDTPVQIAVKHISTIEETGDGWYPNFLDSRIVEVGKQYNAMANLKIVEVHSGDATVTIEKDTYLRLVWYTHDNQDLLFGILDSPQFLIPVNSTAGT